MTESAEDVSVVTGVTSGLGRALFAQLAAEGGPVIAVSRPGSRAQAVVDEVAGRTGNSALHLVETDLSLLADVRASAEKISALAESNGWQLGRVVMNAATLTASHELTSEGIDKMLAVNHLGVVEMVMALEGLLKGSPAAHVCLVSSDAHRWVDAAALATLEPDYAGTRLSGTKQYGATKLAGLVFFAELARRWSQVKVTAHHPGFVSTNLGLHGSWLLRIWWRLSRWRMRDPGDAAKELLAVAAASPDADGQLRYWEKRVSCGLPSASSDPRICEAVWRWSRNQREQ